MSVAEKRRQSLHLQQKIEEMHKDVIEAEI